MITLSSQQHGISSILIIRAQGKCCSHTKMFSGKSGKENGDTIVLNISLFTSKGCVTLSTRLRLNIFLVRAFDPFRSIHFIHAATNLALKQDLGVGGNSHSRTAVHLHKTHKCGGWHVEFQHLAPTPYFNSNILAVA